MKTYTFLLNFGYVESTRLAYVPFTSTVELANAKLALVDLANFLKEHFLEKHGPKLKKCCLANKEKDPHAQFCSKCSRSLVNEDFDVEGYMDFIKEIGECDIDTYHGNYVEYSDDLRWDPTGGLGPEKDTRLVYNAEKVLAAAIGHSPDNRVNIEKIFEQRTKSGSDSFSFWG